MKYIVDIDYNKNTNKFWRQRAEKLVQSCIDGGVVISSLLCYAHNPKKGEVYIDRTKAVGAIRKRINLGIDKLY